MNKIVSNLQRGRNVVAKFLYNAKSIVNLTQDIENLSYQDFNIKYGTKFKDNYSFEKSIYRLYNTYFKQSRKGSLDEFYKKEIKKSLDNRKAIIISLTDWDLFMTSNYANQFDSEKIVLYNQSKNNNAYFGYYAKLSSSQKTIFLEDIYNNLDFYEDYFVSIILSETAYLKCIRTDKSFTYYYKSDLGLIQLRFFFYSMNDMIERSVNTPPMFFFFDRKSNMYKIKDFEHQLNRIFKKEDLNKKYSISSEESPDFDKDFKTIMMYVLVYSFGNSKVQFDERKNEIGKRVSIYLRY